jgi:hypothetical protein
MDLLNCTTEVCTEIEALISRQIAGLESVLFFAAGTENCAHCSRHLMLKYRSYSSAVDRNLVQFSRQRLGMNF